jgi:hypothetical protein
VQSGNADGTFYRETDHSGLLWGGAGRAWTWAVVDAGRVEELGFPAYSEV